MITECWTPQTSHRDTVFSIYLVSTATVKQAVLKNTMETKNCIYMHTIEEIIDPPLREDYCKWFGKMSVYVCVTPLYLKIWTLLDFHTNIFSTVVEAIKKGQLGVAFSVFQTLPASNKARVNFTPLSNKNL